MSEARIIKRYANRKLYDTQRSRYVTLDQIAEMIRAGEDVKIVDNNSKEDLTSITLAQILFEEEKRQKSFLSLSAMRGLIQTGGESIQELASQAGARVRSVFRRGGADAPEGAPEAAPSEAAVAAPGAAAAGPAEGDGAGHHHLVREFLDASQRAFDEWQRRIDERVRNAVEGLSPLAPLQKEVSALADRIADLERRLGSGEPPPPGPPSADKR